MSRPASSSGVYGFTDAIVGTFERMRNVGMISNSDATTTATVVSTVNSSGERLPLAVPAEGRRSAPTRRPGDRGAVRRFGTALSSRAAAPGSPALRTPPGGSATS